MTRTKYRNRSSDELSVFVSLAVAIGILISAVATMWIWTTTSHGTKPAIVGNAIAIP
ncbi:MAG: hypothetical protein QM706_08445 [Nitrospira sp.]